MNQEDKQDEQPWSKEQEDLLSSGNAPVIFENQLWKVNNVFNRPYITAKKSIVVSLVELPGYKLLLEKIGRPNMKTHYELPGVFKDQSDTYYLSACIRELKEELGITEDQIDIEHSKNLGKLIPDTAMIGMDVQVAWIKLKYFDESKLTYQSNEDILEVGVFTLRELFSMIKDNVITDAYALSALMKYVSYREDINTRM